MNWRPLRWLRRVPRILAAPRPEPAQQERRILAIQRNIVLPAKLVVIGVVFYYLFFSRWVGEAASTYGVVLETMQDLFAAYVILNIAAAAVLFVVRRFPPGFVQWIVFAVGLVDGLLLAGLTVLTGGFDSILYWVFPGMIVLNAISIPLATPQIVLNLALSAFYLGAGFLEPDVCNTEITLPNLPPRAARNTGSSVLSADDLKDLPSFAAQLRRQSDPASRFLWRRFSQTTRQELSADSETNIANAELRRALGKELNRILLPAHHVTITASAEAQDNPTEPFLLRLAVLWLLTICCYGVQALAARQELAEEEQKEFVARTEQLRTAGRLAAEIAHELKNPLGIINNALYSLQRAARDSRPASLQQLEMIQEEVEHSDRILTQLMGYAQLSEGRVEKLSVIEELDRAIAQVFPPAVPIGTQVHREYGHRFPPLLMQRRHLFETFVNLLQNAREALADRGHVYVTAQCRRDYSVEVTVRDDGPGIPPDKLERIFEAYYTTKVRGTGLGLAIVKHNVELYGGVVRVESELGKGAKFTLVFAAKALMNLSQ